MATTPRSYKKDGYTYTESAPGSNKFQNFTAKPTVKKVREDSRADKAEVAARKTTTRSTLEVSTSPRDTVPVSVKKTSSLGNATSPRDKMYPKASTQPDSAAKGKRGLDRAKAVEKKSYPSRPMGMDSEVRPRGYSGQEKRYPGKGIKKIRDMYMMYPNQRSIMMR